MCAGILTFPNSKSVQMFALYRVREELGCGTEIINYDRTELLGLEGRAANERLLIGNPESIDYEKVNRRGDHLRQKSLDFLRSALKQ